MNRKARHKARCSGMQALYQLQITDKSLADIELEILSDERSKKIDRDYFRRLVLGAVEDIDNLDALIAPHCDRPLLDVSPLELAILRLSMFELKHCLDTPYRVVLNEAIELAKKYGAVDSHKFVNGVLDKAVADLRSTELNTE